MRKGYRIMDFNDVPPVHVVLGRGMEFYEEKLRDYRVIEPYAHPLLDGVVDSSPDVEGKILLEEGLRSVRINFEKGVSYSLVLTDIRDDDRLFGVKLVNKPRRVNKKLRKLGHETSYKSDDIALIDERMVVNFVDNEPCGIHWYDKDKTSAEELVWTIS